MIPISVLWLPLMPPSTLETIVLILDSQDSKPGLIRLKWQIKAKKKKKKSKTNMVCSQRLTTPYTLLRTAGGSDSSYTAIPACDAT